MAEEPIKRLSVEVTDRLHHQLRSLALEQRTTVSEIVRRLIEKELEGAQRKKERRKESGGAASDARRASA